VALATAIGVTVMVYLAGDSGARAVWDHYPNLSDQPLRGEEGG
jgi:hypothetical protein